MRKKSESFLQKSHKRIDNLKKRLLDLNKKENQLENNEKHLSKAMHHKGEKIEVSLSIESVFKSAFAILTVIALVYLVVFIKQIIIIFLVSLFLSAAFNPAIDALESKKIPRAIGILVMYAIVIGVLIILFTSLIPIIAEQLTSIALSLRIWIQELITKDYSNSALLGRFEPLIEQLWMNIDQAQVLGSITDALKQIGSQLGNVAGNAIGALFAIFNGIFNLILVLIITFFMIMNKKDTTNFFHSLFPSKYSAYITLKTKQISFRIGEWIRGQIMLAIAMAILTFIVFSVIGLNFATTLAMVSAIGEFIPYLGPIITFGSAAIIALNQDPILIIWLIPAYAIIQFLEGNIMVPLIVGRSVGLNPVVILFALLSGASLGAQVGGSASMGLLGMILAVPVANIISIFVEDYTEKNK